MVPSLFALITTEGRDFSWDRRRLFVSGVGSLLFSPRSPVFFQAEERLSARLSMFAIAQRAACFPGALQCFSAIQFIAVFQLRHPRQASRGWKGRQICDPRSDRATPFAGSRRERRRRPCASVAIALPLPVLRRGRAAGCQRGPAANFEGTRI